MSDPTSESVCCPGVVLDPDPPDQHFEAPSLEELAEELDEVTQELERVIEVEEEHEKNGEARKVVADDEKEVARRRLMRAIIEADGRPLPGADEWKYRDRACWQARIGGRIYGIVGYDNNKDEPKSIEDAVERGRLFYVEAPPFPASAPGRSREVEPGDGFRPGDCYIHQKRDGVRTPIGIYRHLDPSDRDASDSVEVLLLCAFALGLKEAHARQALTGAYGPSHSIAVERNFFRQQLADAQGEIEALTARLGEVASKEADLPAQAEGQAKRIEQAKGLVKTAIRSYEAARKDAHDADHCRHLHGSTIGHRDERPGGCEVEGWKRLDTAASCGLRDAEGMLCDAMISAYEMLAPERMEITHEMEVERDHLHGTSGFDDYIPRGFRVGDVVYVVNQNPDGSRDGIITRAEIGHVLDL